MGSNSFSTQFTVGAYRESISYDANGNILAYLRNGAGSAAGLLQMDSLRYHYYYLDGNNERRTFDPLQPLPTDAKHLTNQLSHVRDAVAQTNYSDDLDDQSEGNYAYDRTGYLIKDSAEGINAIGWTVYGKIKTIDKQRGVDLLYGYDAGGNRIVKKVMVNDSSKYTYYVRDAQGNVLAVYHKAGTGAVNWGEQHLYGSSRLGLWQWGGAVPAAAPVVVNNPIYDSLLSGSRVYELSNHLGNVLATVSDKKIGVPSAADSSLIDHFAADVVSAQDYYPFGMLMPGRRGRQSGEGWQDDADWHLQAQLSVGSRSGNEPPPSNLSKTI